MPRWLRVIRGMVGVGLTFALGVGIVASLVFALPSWLILGGEAGREALELVVKSAIWAFPIGVVFSGVLALTARGLSFDRLSLPRVAALGAGGGLVLFGLLAANAWQAWTIPTAIANAAILVFLGSGSATATLLIARKASPALTSGDESRRLGEGS